MFDISNELSTKTIKRLYYYIVIRIFTKNLNNEKTPHFNDYFNISK